MPDQRTLSLPGYPGAPVRLGNHVNTQFQLDALGEVLLLLAAADRAGRLDEDGRAAVQIAIDAIQRRRSDPDAGIWELDARRWAHSRLIALKPHCVSRSRVWNSVFVISTKPRESTSRFSCRVVSAPAPRRVPAATS